MKIQIATLIFSLLIISLRAQTPLQDTTLNNLVHPSDYKTCKLGELGSVSKYGKGKQSIILVPGLGFGGDIFDDFIREYKNKYTIYAITPAGFGGTIAPPMPEPGVKYSELTWTNGIVTGILSLIEKEKLIKPVIVSHFITGTQVAFKLAINYPDKISKIIIIGGSPYRYYGSPKNNSQTDIDWDKERVYTAEQRSMLTEKWIAPKWFKTVTKKTYDSFMWTPDDYCKDTLKGKQLFKTSAEVPLQVMIRYMIEWGTYDANETYKEIKVPALVLIPDFKGILDGDNKDTLTCKRIASKLYLKYYNQQPWEKAKESGNSLIKLATIPDTRIFMWYDNSRETFKTISDFLKQ
jgi:pimeloyl-ACP methyl ester carboxylesterase